MKTKLFTLLLFLTLGLLFINYAQASSLATTLKGKILLQVEQNGEAWYINPKDEKRYYMGRPQDAFNLMRNLGVGIKNSDLSKIQVADANLLSGPDSDGDGLSDIIENSFSTDKNKIDTDSDGYNDKTEILNGYNPLGSAKLNLDISFSKQQAGKILLQVEQNGEAWYVYPGDNKRYFLGRPADAFNIMRSLGLGVTDKNLKLIGSANTENISEKELSGCDALPNKLDLCEPFSCKFEHPFTGELMEKKIVGLKNGKCQYTEEMPNNGRMDCEYTESMRKATAQYYRDVAAESVGTSVNADLGSGDVDTTYTIDGKEVENPLQDAMDTGQCVISGYKESQIEGEEETETQNNEPTAQVTFDSIKFDKESYSMGSSARATINISYSGKPFYGLILVKMSKEGFSGYRGKYIYSNYHKFLVDGKTSLNKPVAFSYSNMGTSWPSELSFFEDKGNHNYEFLLYDCSSIQIEFNKECDEVDFGTDTFDDGLPSQEPLDRMLKTIEVK